MSIKISCPKCDRDYVLADTMASKTIRCKDCEKTFRVDAPEEGLVSEQDMHRNRSSCLAVKSARMSRAVEDEEIKSRQRRNKRKKGQSPIGLLVGGGIALLLVIGGAVLLLFLMGGNKLKAENVAKVKLGMSMQEVIALVGKPTETSSSDKPTWAKDGLTLAVTFKDDKATKVVGGGREESVADNTPNVPRLPIGFQQPQGGIPMPPTVKSNDMPQPLNDFPLAEGSPTIFMVNGEPEKFAGKTVVFDKAVLLGGVVRRGDEYELQVGNEKAAKPDDLTFSLSRQLANQLNDAGQLPENLPVHLTCRIMKMGNRWHAQVQQIALVGNDGKVMKEFAEGAQPPLAAGNPTMFMVNGEPEKYQGQTILFDKAVLFGGTIRRGDDYELQAGNEKLAKPGDLTFSLSKKFANKLAEEGRLPPNQPVQLTCKIEKIGNQWHARVQKIALVGNDGKVNKTFTED
jgi:SmpA / OmlA family